MLELKPFPRSNSDKDRKDAKGYVWRVDRFRGFAGPESPGATRCHAPVEGDDAGAKLIVLDDVGNGFRHDPAVWPKALAQAADERIVLWKLARPLGESALVQHLLAQHRDRTIVVLDVDDLRAEGASISRQLSWERTASDVIHALAHDRHFSVLREMAHLVVRLDLEAALHVSGLGTARAGESARLTDTDFGDAKGPDFVSRLRGYIDVRGTDRREPEDAIHVIRRAVLLRSLLQRKAPALFTSAGLLRLEAGVLRAFLRCGTFRHGARSMEAIIDMSLLAGRETFERSSLPGAQQLDLHVDAAEFMKLVKQDVTLREHRAKVAQAIHERFLREQTGRKPPTDPSMQPWAALPDNYRQDNFAQADDMARKLSLIGCDIQEIKKDDGLERLVLSKEEIELLAEAEHDRWTASKRQQGYTYAPGDKRDVEPKTHPCLVPWSELPDLERDKDRKTVQAIPEFLESAGFRVVKMP